MVDEMLNKHVRISNSTIWKFNCYDI